MKPEDIDKIKADNVYHASDPQPGDYWHEMFCPQFVVLHRDGDDLVICHYVKAVSDRRWTWDISRAERMTVAQFNERIGYGSQPGHWCWVAPGAHKDFADYYAALGEAMRDAR